jgi:hypothetical protein
VSVVSVGFVVHGEFVTQHARDRALENGWKDGVEFLVNSMSGIDYQIAVDIVKGHKKLIGESGRGVNTIDLVDDADAKMAQALVYQYAGIVKEGKDFWQPYAFVSSFSAADVNAGQHLRSKLYGHPVKMVLGTSANVKWSKSRCCYYMNDPVSDRVEITAVDGVDKLVLFQKVEPPILGWNCIRWSEGCWAASVREYCQYHSLRDVGAVPSEDVTRHFWDASSSKRYSRVSEDSSVDDSLTSGLVQAGFDPDAIAGTLKHLTTDVDEVAAVVRADVADSKYGFILPNGHFYACSYFGHSALALRLFKHFNYAFDGSNVVRRAEELGWLTVSKSMMGDMSAIIFRSPTERQRATFEEWCLVHGFPVEDLAVYRN